ncbi:hypothetical protein [Spirulina sp. CCNP1310]|nr:hypothetical protein [Spirulina sp. CCNP1310]
MSLKPTFDPESQPLGPTVPLTLKTQLSYGVGEGAARSPGVFSSFFGSTS